MSIILAPGVHPPDLTHGFCRDFQAAWPLAVPMPPLWIVPPSLPPFSPCHHWRWLQQQVQQDSPRQCPTTPIGPLTWITFSAGGVGAIGAAQTWQRQGGQVQGFCALDAWGLPLGGRFAIARLSHDRFTHRTSVPLGTGPVNFYADPPVAHWDLWRSPGQVRGWRVDRRNPSEPPQPQTAAQFLVQSCLSSRPGYLDKTFDF